MKHEQTAMFRRLWHSVYAASTPSYATGCSCWVSRAALVFQV